MRRVFHSHVLVPLRGQLKQGVTPSKLALALALGLVVGVIPILGVTTAICALLAVWLRLNQPAIQVANYVAYPLQLLLFVPAFQAGAWLFGRLPLTFSFDQFRAELGADALGTIGRYLADNLRALAVWGLLAPLACGFLYLLLRAVLTRLPLPGTGGAGPDGSPGGPGLD